MKCLPEVDRLVVLVFVTLSLGFFVFPMQQVSAQTSNSSIQSPGSHQTNLTTLKLQSISNVKPGQSITVTGSLSFSDTDRGIGSAEITFDGSGATNPSSTTTKQDGSFSSVVVAPNSAANGWKVQAHFAGFPGAEFGPSPSNSKTVTYDTVSSSVAATTTIQLDPIPSASVNPGQSMTVTGSLKIRGDQASYERGQTITIDGTGVGSPSCTTTTSGGSFSCTFRAPHSSGTGRTVQAHFSGVPSNADLPGGIASSDSNTLIISTETPSPLPSPTPSPLPSPTPSPLPSPTPSQLPPNESFDGIVAVGIVAVIIFGLYKIAQKIKHRHRKEQEGSIVDVDVQGGID